MTQFLFRKCVKMFENIPILCLYKYLIFSLKNIIFIFEFKKILKVKENFHVRIILLKI